MAKLFLIGLCSLMLSSQALSQVINTSNLPAEIKYSGKIHSVQTFTDTLGKHILISSELITPRDRDDGGSSYVFVYDYLKKEGAYTLNWKLEDGIQDCNLDYEAAFKAKPIVSDLDKNGIKEVTMVYSQICTGGVSSSEYKVIMREDKNKYALRGLTFDPVSQNDAKNPCCSANHKNKDEPFFDGMYHDENDFKKKNTPKAFLAHAKKIWIKYRTY